VKPEQLTGSHDFRRLNPHIFPQGSGQVAVVECDPRNAALAENQSQARPAGCVLVRFTSVRKRLLDPDNLSCKWLLDSLRYVGAIRGDEPDRIALEAAQRKAAKNETEHTLIEVFQIA